ncbi:hypothetical protein RclHR1_00620002 [Rhizophagus clarus]|uniref:Uncharacterized protein n=1 Tax=Rhizophagus clarus TaxID=94130 RepID=A0A2Z6S921_9GLOM|nr:hypothetical protein RclHR1_00620002 [Rhizophagus clarus]GES99907.1 hypothetical protein RCL_jg2862.t1 [Rhizophagus clarus]
MSNPKIEHSMNVRNLRMRYTIMMVSIPLFAVTSFVLFKRVVKGEERKKNELNSKDPLIKLTEEINLEKSNK